MGSKGLRNILRCSLLALALSGCAESQMRYNVLSYDNAIAQGANQQLLLNAVRASQHYPMSFTAMGQVLASPAVGGSLESPFSFSRAAGLTTYGLTSKLDASAGYGNFALDNLNYQRFMQAIRSPVPDKILKTFRENPQWPRGLLPIIHIQSVSPTEAQIRAIDTRRKAICVAPPRDRDRHLCDVLEPIIAEYAVKCTLHFREIGERLKNVHEDRGYYYNSARTYCHFARFEILIIEMRLTGWDPCPTNVSSPRCIHAVYRTPLDMIGYLGELIAAQIYIDEPFPPFVVIGESTPRGHYDFEVVPLFEVRRGVLGADAEAVSVIHQGDNFYIPRPDFGSRREARSLQTLDLVLQTLRAATTREDLPKLQTLGVVNTK